MLTLRPYQRESIDALNLHLQTKTNNPCVVLPTGAGKSLVMASAIAEWRKEYPPFRCIVLAHRKELVEQNSAEYMGLFSDAADGSVGIYAAGLGMKNMDAAITFAGIDSVYRKAGHFKPFDAIIVDEAHRIPVRGEGKYREFISMAKELNPNIRVVGFTATPYRLGSGPICHKDYILNEICYEANIAQLIADGYLSPLRSKCGEAEPNLTDVKKSGGDYQQKDLGRIMADNDLVCRAVADALSHLNAEGRKCVVWFCTDIKHVDEVSRRLWEHGEKNAVVTGKTDAKVRDRLVEEFRAGVYRHILNVNVFTEGFNVKQVDAVVLLRPTLSKGLYCQMVGRGLRLHPNKKDCIILDYARCIETHGPIDDLGDENVRIAICSECREVFARPLGKCPHCGWEIPKQEVERMEREERQRAEHEARAARLAILGSLPQRLDVDDVSINIHRKENSPESLCVTYRSGMRTVREWLCFGHGGYAEKKARDWWRDRFGNDEAERVTVQSIAGDMFSAQRIKAVTKSVTALKKGKYYEVVGWELFIKNNLIQLGTKGEIVE